jgi:hypothetical protein
MATRTELVCVQQFAANGKDYGVGDVIPKKDVQAWPDESLPNRLNNGFVKYDTVEVPDKEPKAPVAE